MEKKQLTAEEIYKKNQKKSKVLRIISPIVFWGCLALAVLCLIFAVKNSFGNIAEICTLLENKNYTGEQLQENYAYLIDKYGEWTIGTGANGFQITFINIAKALFSGLMITNCILSVVLFVSAYVLGKWLLPKISAQILIDNQDMVNMTILKNQKDKG
jgi:hypothetical protein